jgi:carnosine synthase
VVFVTGAILSKAFQFNAARRLGLNVVIIDSASSAGLELRKTGLIDIFVSVELSTDPDLATLQCVEAIEALGRNVIGVVTFMEMAVLLASKVASCLDLPGLNPEGVATVRDKYRMREAMRTCGLASVSSFSIKHEEDIAAASRHVGYPAVLKPIIGADSLGVKRVDSEAELLEAFKEGVKVMHSLCITSGLLSNCEDSTKSASTPILPVEFVLEEYLDGQEVDVDVLLHEGVCYYAAVSDNGPTVEPYFTETYGTLPSLLPVDSQKELIQLSIDSVMALRMSTGLFHIEAKLTSRGPRLIEVNARLGGGPICEMHKRVSGIDLAEQQIRLAIGLTPSPHISDISGRSFAYMTTNAVASGVIGSDLSFLNKYREDVLKLSCRVRAGDRVVGPADGQPSWLVEIWMEGNEDVSSLVDRIVSVSDEIAVEFVGNYL